MPKPLFVDTHCHLQGTFYRGDAHADCIAAQQLGVTKIVLPGTTMSDSRANIAFAKAHLGVFAAAGIHPLEVTAGGDAAAFWASIKPHEIVAVGETGIDLYRPNHPPLAWQVASLHQHIAFARAHGKPVIVHARHAEAEVYAVLAQYPDVRFVMHCFTGSWDWAAKFLALGAYISMAGVVTYPQAKVVQEVAARVPLTRLLCETDAPFLTPAPHRTVANAPRNIPVIAQFITTLRTEPPAAVLTALYENACQVFGI